ncbi:Winged helix-like DNA-binding domain superfamily [Sesbania bispinosa]|nr:Winged helix-like DNA-binding domain superfamily [Sesbania bispinosa]
MSRLQGSPSLKRKRQDLALVSESLTDGERILYNLIHSKKDLGIWTGDMKRETNLPDNVVKKSLKLLQSKNLIKEVVNIQNKGRKHYMAAEFEPSKEITGGDWYSEGSLDTDLINLIKDVCLKYIFRQKVVTRDGVLEWSTKSGVFSAEVTTQQIEEILRTLVLDDEIMEVKSTGFGDFASVPVGRVCYKCKSKGGVRGEQKASAMASIPCGVCPRINFCTPDGIVSPKTCVYFQKWLDF